MERPDHLAWLAREVWARRTLFIGALLATAASAGLYLLMPWWAADLIRRVAPGGAFGDLLVHLALGASIFIAASLCSFARTYWMKRVSLDVTSELRRRIFHHVLSTSPIRLRSLGGGDLLSSFSTDLWVFEGALTQFMAVLAPATILLACFSLAMIWNSWILFVCVILLAAPLVWATSHFGSHLVAANEKAYARLATVIARFDEATAGVKEIKSAGQEEAVAARFDALNDETMKTLLRREKLSSLQPNIITIVATLGVCAMILLSSLLLNRGLITVETLTAFLVSLGLAYSPLGEVSRSLSHFAQFFVVMKRIHAILDLPPEEDGAHRPPSGRVAGALRFDRVGFAYDDGAPILSDISFDAPPGQMIAVVGPSGAGKSTLLDLIPRFLAPTEGAVLIDGVDARQWRLRDLRRDIAVVSQETMLFEGTLAENLRFAAPDANDEDMRRAARAAHVEEFALRMADGYESRIETRGRNLSVGQRQRVAIARAILKDARILLLDEPTSALDPESESLVRDAIEQAAVGRTTLIIAHRLETVRRADRIIVVDRGRIVEDGPHDALLAAGRLYRKLHDERFSAMEAA